MIRLPFGVYGFLAWTLVAITIATSNATAQLLYTEQSCKAAENICWARCNLIREQAAKENCSPGYSGCALDVVGCAGHSCGAVYHAFYCQIPGFVACMEGHLTAHQSCVEACNPKFRASTNFAERQAILAECPKECTTSFDTRLLECKHQACSTYCVSKGAGGGEWKRFSRGAWNMCECSEVPVSPLAGKDEAMKQLAIADTEADRSIKECEDLEGELEKLNELQEDINALEIRYQLTRAKISLQRIAVRNITVNLDRVNRIIDAPKKPQYPSVVVAKEWKRLLDQRSQLRDKRVLLLIEQDEDIFSLKQEFNLRLNAIEEMQDRSACPSAKKAMSQLYTGLVKRRDLVELELYLVSGQSLIFEQKANEYIDKGKYKAEVLSMLALSYLEQGRNADALYAVRDALKISPDSHMLIQLLQSIEVAYLKAIDARVQGEAAYVRQLAIERFNEQGMKGWWSVLYDVADMGIITPGRVLWGDYDKLELLQSKQLYEAANQHIGLLLITRLREKGLTLEQIRGIEEIEIGGEKQRLNNRAFIALVKELFGEELSPDRAMKLRFAMHQAYQNEDVARLFKPSRQQFIVDQRGAEYFETEAFDKYWLEYVGDAIDIKNVFFFLGPSAVVSSDGHFVWFSRGMQWEELTAATTVRDWFAGKLQLTRLLEYAKEQQWWWVDELMTFEAQASLPQKILAEYLVQEGLISVGADLGGNSGRVAMEWLTQFTGLGDIDQTVRLLRRAGVKPSDLTKLMQQATDELAQATSLKMPEKQERLLKESLRQWGETGSISTELAGSLKQTSDELRGKLDELARQMGESELDPLSLLVIRKMQLTQQAAEQLAKGNTATVRLLSERIDEVADEIKNAEELLKTTMARLKAGTADLRKGILPEVTDSEIMTIGGLRAQEMWLKKFDDTALPRDAPEHVRTVLRDANKALWDGDLAAARKGIQEADDLVRTMIRGTDDATLRQKLSKVVRDIEERLTFVKAAESETKTILSAGSALQTAAMREIDDIERLRVSDAISNALEGAEKEAQIKISQMAKERAKIEGKDISEVLESLMEKRVKEGKNISRYDEIYEEILDQEQYMPRLLTTSGGKTAFGPRTIKVGDQVYVYKPASSEAHYLNDINAEIAAYEFSKELGRNSPASALGVVTKGQTQSPALIMRYVERGTDLVVARPWTVTALKKRIAEDRVFSLFLGDYDRHRANYLIANNHVFSTDHGLGELIDTGDNRVASEFLYRNASDEELKAWMKKRLIDKYEFQLKANAAQRPILAEVDRHITFSDMEGMVKEIERLKPEQIDRILDGLHFKSATHKEWARKTLLMRRDVIGEAFKEVYNKTNSSSIPGLERRLAVSCAHTSLHLAMAA